MLTDSQYLKSSFRLSEIEHKYGKNVHVLADPYLFTTLAKLCRTDCKQPLINQLLNILYRELVKTVVNHEFPEKETTLDTRMLAYHPEGSFKALVLDPATRVVCVNLARAGTEPSLICYDSFNNKFHPDGFREDDIAFIGKTDENEKVIGTYLGGTKIGGDIEGAFVVIPDPMGATGSTICTAMEIYGPRGKAKRFIAIHLVVTPEYLAAVTKKYPELAIYAIRLDRGLSSAKVLATVPGTHWKEEKGLNEKQYIVPGAGGLGEVINNSYV